MEVEIISEEYIKPSSPTPYHLRNHKFSLLDLYAPTTYYPLILYYTLDQDANHSPADIDHNVNIRLHLLKQSLSETLSLVYPFAGKLKDFDSIECNDEGIYFVRGQVKGALKEFLNQPDTVLAAKFVPHGGKAISTESSENYVTGVQVTTFACGGIVIGVRVSHSIADGTTLISFLKSWARTAHKNTEDAIRPKFDAVSLFPPNDAYPRQVCSSVVLTSYMKFDNFITRRFVFDASAIANLKAKAKCSWVQNPTRVEAVTALLTKCIMTALKVRSGSTDDRPFLLSHAVNLRRKATLPFSEYQMGNFVWRACALCKDKEAELPGLVSQLREAITKLNGDFVSSLQGDSGLLKFIEAVKYERETFTGAADSIGFTSWCNFGFYDIDFGWGKPAWASFCDAAELTYFRNLIVLMDTRVGNDIEAWVYLGEEDMARLQLDRELLEFASIDPSPLKQANLVSNG
ncbi:vinorine synthase-like [Melia azedarach]|uniref:Vinorine synthase-like n=1 Tax=Melia azedarach TaxID=155640 RepID=A0ACC1Y1P0_MELAZ|nr:vinorine synthase-like [Melia azedarach]